MSVSNEVLLDVQGLQKAYGSNQVLNGITTQTVSYTHLTLPTILLV